MKNKLAALGAIEVEWSRCAVQDVFGSIRIGDLKFPLGAYFGEGQSGDESPHSKVCQARVHSRCAVALFNGKPTGDSYFFILQQNLYFLPLLQGQGAYGRVPGYASPDTRLVEFPRAIPQVCWLLSLDLTGGL